MFPDILQVLDWIIATARAFSAYRISLRNAHEWITREPRQRMTDSLPYLSDRGSGMEFPYFLIYLLTKTLAYVGWCYVGLRCFAPERPRLFSAMKYGTARLLLGIVLGVLIFFAALSMNNAIRNAPLTYLAIYVPVRIFEWGLFYFWMRRRRFSWCALCWILGGVIISCLADLPIAISEGGVVPVGRPFC